MAIFWVLLLMAVLLAVVLLRGNRVRVGAGLLTAVAVASVIGVVAPGSPAQAAEPFTVNVSPHAPTGGEPTLQLWNNLYSVNKAALQALEGTGDPTTLVFSATTGAKMPGLPTLTGKPNTAHLYFDDATYDLTVIFETTFLGQDAEVLVSARWTNTTDDYDPELAVVMRFDEISLGEISDGWDAFPVHFTNALLGFADEDHTLEPSSTLGTANFFDDTVATTTDNFHVLPHGAALQAVLSDDASSDDPLFEGAGVLGATDTIVLRGTLGAVPGGEEDSEVTGIDITASVVTSTPPQLAETGVTLDTAWSLQVIAGTGGTITARISGNATLDLDGDPMDFGAVLTITYDKVAQKSGFKLEGSVGNVNNLFDVSWLDLNQLKVVGDISRDGSQTPPQTTVSLSVLANMTIGPVTAQATLGLKRNLATGDSEFSLGLSATGSVQVTDILTAVGAPAMDDGWKVELTNLGFQVTIKKPAASATTTIVAVTGGANLLERTCGGTNYPGGAADLLFRFQTGGGNPTQFIIAGALSGLNVKNLSCDIPFEWTLPNVLLMASNTAIETAWSGVDTPTKNFFENYYCGTTGTACDTLQRFTCVGASVPCPVVNQKLKIAQGFSIRTLVTFDGDMVDALEAIGLTVDGPLIMTGTLPLFGGDTFSLDIALPPFTTGPDDIVAGGAITMSLEMSGTSVAASISGTMDFRIQRPNQATCATVPATGTFTNGDCYDTLTFIAEIGITVSAAPPSVELKISASVFNWVHAFGEENLTFSQLTLELSVAAGADGVTLDLGMRASMLLGQAPNQTDLTLAVWVEIGVTPPRILVKGFTVGTARGISLRDVVTTFAPDLEEEALPPALSLKNLWIAYGTETNNTLCIRQGLFISAELHLNDPDPGSSVGTNPACGGNTFPTPECGPGESSCIAAIEVDIGPKRFKVYGALGAFDIGPISFGGVELLIDLSLLKQEIYFKGAATLYDPIGYYANDPDGTDSVWASGYLKIQIKQDTGQFSLGLTGCALVGGTAVADEKCETSASTLLQAYIKGSITVDFTKIGLEFFTSASADFEVSLSSPALEKLMEDLAEELQPVITFFEDAGKAIEGTANEVITKVNDQFCVSFNPNCADLQVSASAYKDAPSYIAAQKSALDTAIKNSAAVGAWCFATFDWPVDDCVQDYRNDAAAAIDSAVSAAGGLTYISLWGIDRAAYGGIKDADFDVWYVNPVHLKWPSPGPALCAPGGQFAGSSICGGTPSADDIVAEAIYYQLQQLDPTTAALLAGRGASAPQSTGAPNLGDDQQFIDDVRKLASTFDLNKPFSMCEAKATFSFDESGVDGAPTFLSQVDAHGGLSKPAIDITSNNNNAEIDLESLREQLFLQILEDDVPNLNCPLGAEAANLSFEMSASAISEGGSVTLTGTADADATVTVTWGDGSTNSTATASGAGAWTASHTYADGPAIRVIKADAPGADQIAAILTVANVAPTITGISVSPGTGIDEGGTVSLGGTYTDPGTLDTQTLVIDWGDGTTTEVAVAAGAETFSADHTYPDDDPTATAEDTYEVAITIRDKDGATDSDTASAIVKNVAPGDLQITSATWAGGTATLDGDGHLQVPEGVEVTWTGTFRDPGLADTFNAVVDWGDDKFGTVLAERDATDPAIVNFAITHVFADDEPSTGTPSDLVTIRIRVTDDDTGGVEISQAVRITNVAPGVVVSPDSQTIQYSDGTASIVLTATDVVGIVTPGGATEALTASTRWKLDDGDWQVGLFGGMTWSSNGCVRTGEPGDADAVQTCTWTVGSVIADLVPGHYVIEFTVIDDDLGKTVKTADIVIEPEDARATYIGATVVSAPSVNNGYIDVELRATIQDSSDVAGLVPPDLTPGDIRKATVTFVDRATDTVLCTAPVVEMFEGNTVRAGATCIARLSSTGSGPQWGYDVGIVVGGWYARDDAADDARVTVVKPNQAYVTLGSVIRADSPAGPYGPDKSSTITIDGTDFRFGKGFLSIQSQAYIEFTSGGVPYMGVITGVDSFGMYRDANGRNVAEVQGWVTIRSAVRKQPSVLVGSHLRILLRFTGGSPSTVSFAIFDATGKLVAASNWDTVQPVGANVAWGSVRFNGMANGGAGDASTGLPWWYIPPGIKSR